ncbi:MAG: sulfatase [Actinomycetota bacterium]
MAVAVVAVVAAGALVGPLARAASAATSEPPSVVLVVTDDQRAGTLDAMPTVRAELAGRGVDFPEAFVTNPLCCPSRASILTGQYSHSTGVYRQVPPFGRFEWFRDDDTIATRLDDAGYETALFGKYLDGYQHAALSGYVPPGWDRWEAFVRSAYVDYRLTHDGTIVDHGDTDADYATDVLAADAASFVRGAAGPLFLVFAPPAPHAPAMPAPRHVNAPVPAARPMPPSFDEADVSDKPGYVRSLPRLDEEARAELERLRVDQTRSLLSVDEGVAEILTALEETGRLENTLMIYTSDNGLLLGEHRWTAKEVPYEEAIRVPFVVRYDPVTRGRPDSVLAPVLNIDIAPTIAEVTGAVPAPVDGRSILPLLQGNDRGWRDAFLIEHLRGTNPVPTYCAIRSPDHLYVEYETGERELYDLERDPFQLRNLAGTSASATAAEELGARLADLCEPPPPGLHGSALAPDAWMTGVLVVLVAGGVVVERRRRRRSHGAQGS